MKDSYTLHTVRISHFDGWFYEIAQSPDNEQWIQVCASDGDKDSELRPLLTFPPDMARRVAKALNFMADHIDANPE